MIFPDSDRSCPSAEGLRLIETNRPPRPIAEKNCCKPAKGRLTSLLTAQINPHKHSRGRGKKMNKRRDVTDCFHCPKSQMMAVIMKIPRWHLPRSKRRFNSQSRVQSLVVQYSIFHIRTHVPESLQNVLLTFRLYQSPPPG